MNSKRSLLPRSSQDTFRAKINRHLDKIKGWTREPWGYWKGNKWPSPSFCLFPLFFSLCDSVSVCASPSPSFPTHSRTNGYLPCWKGLCFLTGKIDNRTAAKKKRKKKPSSLWKKKKKEGTAGSKWEKRMENISLVSVSQVTLNLPHSCNGSGSLATDSQGRGKKNYLSIFVPTGCQDRNRYITFS